MNVLYKYKFPGKERDKESGLDYFGARYYDAEVGRWLSVDPLASKYPGWSPYNYCLNNPLGLVDPDGRDPGDIFKSADEAAHDFGMYYNGLSIKIARELISAILVSFDTDGNPIYTYTFAQMLGPHGNGKDNNQNLSFAVGNSWFIESYIHTHGAYTFGKYYDNEFSDKDITTAKGTHKNIYLCSPNGKLQKYSNNEYVELDKKTKELFPGLGDGISTLNNDPPSDANDPEHNNNTIVPNSIFLQGVDYLKAILW